MRDKKLHKLTSTALPKDLKRMRPDYFSQKKRTKLLPEMFLTI